ncbi:MAG: DUF2937 family protein, partial [Cyclonatronaceae bacterium]
GLLDRIFAVMGAMAAAQFPQFVQQYLQRLAGHAAEARRLLARYEQAAEDVGMGFEAYVQRFSNDPDSTIAGQGQIMTELSERAASLQEAVAALQNSHALNRPFVFLNHLDTEIAYQTLLIFQPGVPTTPEGGLYALTGIALGLLCFNGLKWPVWKIQQKRKAASGAKK